MNWIALEHLLDQTPKSRLVTLDPALDHAELRQRALRLAAGMRNRGVARLAVHLEDAADLAVALLGAWRAGVTVLLPADLQPASRSRLAHQADLWLTDQDGDAKLSELLAEPLEGAKLDLDGCRLLLCTSGSSGEPKLIEKRLRQLANEVETLEACWGADLGDACVIASVAAQHIYGLLFRVLWPLCAGRPFMRRAQPFSEDIQLASRQHPRFCWVASPALLKRMGDNLDWPALRSVRRVFSSGGALDAEAAQRLEQRLGQLPTEIYGSSETGGIAWRQGGKLWHPFVGVQLSQDEQGALRVASPCLPPGHIEQTADAARIEADGRFELLGRLDRIVKLEEKRISLTMLEAALNEHPFVSDTRLGVINENRAYLAALVALSERGPACTAQRWSARTDRDAAQAPGEALRSAGPAASLAAGHPAALQQPGQAPPDPTRRAAAGAASAAARASQRLSGRRSMAASAGRPAGSGALHRALPTDSGFARRGADRLGDRPCPRADH